MGKHRGRISRLALREAIEGYLFVTPLLIGQETVEDAFKEADAKINKVLEESED